MVEPEIARVLEKSNFWLADGPFKVNFNMFLQFYSLHVRLSGIALACIYRFLPKKTEKNQQPFLGTAKNTSPCQQT